MNRLILIGNGFDLAHGMKTNYGDFIEWCWKKVSDELKNGRVKGNEAYKDMPDTLDTSLVTIIAQYIDNKHSLYIIYPEEKNANTTIRLNYLSEKSLKKEIQHFISNINTIIEKSYNIWIALDPLKVWTKEIRFYNNDLFLYISQGYIDKNWSDVEADYYRLLLKNKENQEKIEKLNLEFKKIKILLKEYLDIQQPKQEIPELAKQLNSPIFISDLPIQNEEKFVKYIAHYHNEYEDMEEYQYEDIREKLRRVENDYKRGLYTENRKYHPSNTMFLNFNYTTTDRYYTEEYDINHIHGTLDNVGSMIFGYGDEEAKEYGELENLSEVRGLLDNVKSINYLNSRNYRDFERFIESEPFQVFIFGMSCGLADRTMLRKVFEHDNCVGIKPFYYAWEDDKTGEKRNNYSELVQNISRCFSDKNKLRSRVVNFEDCEPMPQWKKEN